ncbi:hypothetical protein Krac_1601 [Ktedonobacter racemifer DSM 44963]|uniref:Uncharacterized protein n=1 Tax=Ktedonobacter racemifer DSM 44963 TaxID=485913 RepID=D6U2J4_KTERA|nr:hypothetical protein Krac_1601 [Ktedonobacter racemifer DSM 44963]
MIACTHLDQIRNVEPHSRGCEECLKMEIRGCIYANALPVVMLVAVIHQRISMQRSISTRRYIPSYAHWSLAKAGAGAT